MSQNKLYLPIGIFGSGKSTWARAQDPNTLIVGGDNIRYMLHGGEYIYDESLELTVHALLFDMTDALLRRGHDVILDECYCCLNMDMRERAAFRFANTKIVAVVFPVKGIYHHVEDKVKKGLRGKTPAYWSRVYSEMIEVYEPLNSEQETYFDEIIYV